jgi:hypothetical protein
MSQERNVALDVTSGLLTKLKSLSDERMDKSLHFLLIHYLHRADNVRSELEDTFNHPFWRYQLIPKTMSAYSSERNKKLTCWFHDN